MKNKRFWGAVAVFAIAAVVSSGAGVIGAGAPGASARTRVIEASKATRSARSSARGGLAEWAVTIRPEAIKEGKASSGPYTTADCKKALKIACYSPGQLRQAYDVWPLYRRGITGKGQTIVIVDSYGSPTVKHDLAVFDATYHLSAPPSFRVIQPAGAVAPYTTNENREGWAGETTLDVEYAHAMAPGAAILLVETPTAENEGTTGFPQIVKAEEYVIDHHLGGVISQSFSATEQTFPTAQSLFNLRSAYIDADEPYNNVTVLAASGDSGAADVEYDGSTYYDFPVTSWPDSDPLVTGVGGTELHLDAAGNHTAPDSVWNDTYDTRPPVSGRDRPEPSRRGRRQVDHVRPARLPKWRSEDRRRASGRTGRLDERGLRRRREHLPELRGTAGGLVPDMRDERGHALVRGSRRLGRPVRRPPARSDQPGALRPLSRGCPASST